MTTTSGGVWGTQPSREELDAVATHVVAVGTSREELDTVATTVVGVGSVNGGRGEGMSSLLVVVLLLRDEMLVEPLSFSILLFLRGRVHTRRMHDFCSCLWLWSRVYKGLMLSVVP